MAVQPVPNTLHGPLVVYNRTLGTAQDYLTENSGIFAVRSAQTGEIQTRNGTFPPEQYYGQTRQT